VRAGRVEVSGGFLLVAAAVYYLDEDGLFPWALLACILHEGGHWAAIRLLGGRIRRLRLSAAGAQLCLGPMPPERLFLAALAGPAANFLTAALCAWGAGRGMGWRLYVFAGLNLGLALFNLLPAGCLDGGKAVRAAAAALCPEGGGERAAALCTAVVAASLLLAGLGLLWWSGGSNFTLLLAGVWLAGTAGREEWE